MAIYLVRTLELEVLPAFALLVPYFACLAMIRVVSGAGLEACERTPWWVALALAVGAALTVPLVIAFDTILPASIWMMAGGTVAIFPELVGVRPERRAARTRPPTGRFRRTGASSHGGRGRDRHVGPKPRSPDQ